MPIRKDGEAIGTLEVIADDINVKFGSLQQGIVEKSAYELVNLL